MKLNLVEAIQDMGAAGLTSSSFEMASKGQVGLDLYLDRVPARDKNITAEEILLSESQERMLLICKPENLSAIQKVFEKWSLDAVEIGQVKSKKEISLFWHNEIICEIAPDLIIEKAPVHNRAYNSWQSKNRVEQLTELHVANSERLIKNNISHENSCSREWIYSQYDQRVGASTAKDCSQSVGVVGLPSSRRALGIVLGCQPHVMHMDAQLGGMDAVFRPALKLATKGFQPLAVTDCLNFGNPEKNHIMSEFVAAVEAISLVCEKLDTPVISGNVSFYNETQGQNITSTPATGMVGLKPSLDAIPMDQFQSEGEVVYLLSLNQVETLGLTGMGQKRAPQFTGQLDVDVMASFVNQLKFIVNEVSLVATKVVGKFGLMNSLIKMCSQTIGFQTVENLNLAKKDYFNEKFYQVIVSVRLAEEAALINMLNAISIDGFEFVKLATTCHESVNVVDWFSASTAELSELYKNSWKEHFETLA